MRSVVRAQDVVARWGGEEFLAVLPQVDLEGATAAAERIRQAIMESPVHLPSGELHVTVSIGTAAVPTGGRAKDELLAAVDAALYRAKASSRNCVVPEAEGDRPERAPQMLPAVLGSLRCLGGGAA